MGEVPVRSVGGTGGCAIRNLSVPFANSLPGCEIGPVQDSGIGVGRRMCLARGLAGERMGGREKRGPRPNFSMSRPSKIPLSLAAGGTW